ncbi:MAG: hypothetical protein QOJ98_324 [Acidobacteriota bacterium]|jgi:hypothetical protein|nr:hypothetical protein [Acidobacteriota bacterium]
MDEQKIIDALIARAAEDARAFRTQHPEDVPSDRWIENSFTAALPLAKDSAGLDLGPGPHPQLFDVYKREIATRIGHRPDQRDDGGEVTQQPTPGEN